MSKLKVFSWQCIFLGTTAVLPATSLWADAKSDRIQAIKMHNRIAGVPPTADVLKKMMDRIKDGKPEAAAALATENANFYDITLFNLVTPWSNEDFNVHAPLNDYTATAIGMIRDNLPFDQFLYGDHIYVLDNAKIQPTLENNDQADAFSLYNNDHYQQWPRRDLSLKDLLVHESQVALNPELENQAAYAPAGVYTTRAFAEAYYSAGTNRAAFRFTLKTFFCEDNEAFHDINQPETWIRQDVDRKPAGDPAQFINKCKGCHTGMDALAGAFAYFDFAADGTENQGMRLIFSRPPAGSSEREFSAAVASKYFNNDHVYPSGRRTANDYWLNLWTDGPNQRIGWKMAGREKLEGYGIKSFARMISETKQFRTCMTSKVFRQVCMRDPSDASDKEFITKTADEFGTKLNFSMKALYHKSAVYCSAGE